MNPLFKRLMRQATRLTSTGNLREATRAIQRALGGLGAQESTAGRPADAASPSARAANEDTLVVDVEARLVEAAPSVVEAPAVQTPSLTPATESEEEWIDGLFAHQHRSIAYKLFVPAKGTGEPRPLLLMLHGCTQHPEDFAAGTQMNQLAREHGFLVLYPAQTQHANSSKCWNWFKPQHQQRERGEPALLAALTHSVMAVQSVDPARVYVAGLSAGGAMADILGRTHPDLFAAVGVHSGLPTGAASDLMSALSAMKSGHAKGETAGRMPPTIVFHGDADSTVHPRNGEQVVAAALAGQPETAAPAPQEASGTSTQGRTFTRRTYASAEGRSAVEHWVLHGAGHAWAGGSSQGSFTDPSGPDASAEMLRFFLAHPHASPATVQ
ncbi:PHB depolymerase family esterase [Variovorax sp. J22R115]|uniref:extracellular catalytic domain type 1 short-chain-length polyhydroxyalkanoate depolymerase n=1 Tax=Variovorax sp. J22R115 TaxID=3053509 RepID=UPI0025760F17|nr:PHB depolymerase family esterase [Variovorax sp. J22R115]MDM0050320.1 PHB depolymerase family esterase [Variovorax sp. J22R115]